MTAKEMNKKIDGTTMNKFYRYLFGIAIIVTSLLNMPHAHAEGSKDLYPSGARGNRAFLLSMTGSYIFNPFPTTGRMMVYAEVGETIYLGSSSQGVTGPNGQVGTIHVYSPSGVRSSSGASTTGRIQNRAQELAGPAPLATGGYTPYVVTVNETGIWVVEFWARGTNMSGVASGTVSVEGTPTQNQNTRSLPLAANENWTANTAIASGGDGNTDSQSAFITAWDVTVAKAGSAVPGRVYTTVFNLGMSFTAGSTTTNPDGFFGKLYGLTRDGFTYLVDNNGQNGLSFNTFINNKGTLDAPEGNPNYTSFSYTSTTLNLILNGFHDPRTADTELHVTHKMFYNKPDRGMPETANIWQPTGGTNWPGVYNNTGAKEEVWLNHGRGSMIPEELRLVGVEGREGYYTSKGAYFVFDSEVEGRYNIVIPSSSGSDRVLTGPLFMGENRIYWDGKDGDNNFLLDKALSDVELKVTAAEVHFPFIDVENNPNGISIEALDENDNLYSPTKDLVWWKANLGDLGANNPTNKDNSSGGGHHSKVSDVNQLKWGAFGTSASNFGNDRAIVEWINLSETKSSNKYEVDRFESDLEVSSITRELSVYTVKVKNNGPNAATDDHPATFMFYLPKGLAVDPDDVVFTSAGNAISYYNGNPPTYTAVDSITTPGREVSCLNVKLDMPVGVEGTFTIPFTFTGELPAGIDVVNAWATIMRANEVTDPNAFNEDRRITPVDPFEQANGLQVPLGELNLNIQVENDSRFNNLRDAISGTVPSTGANYTNNIKYASFSLKNYWYGTTDNEWTKEENWTLNYVPFPGQNVEFATAANNIENVEYPGRIGAAKKDLWLDDEDQNGTGGRVIGNLVNASAMNLIITTGNQLIINGTVTDGNPAAGTIIVKADVANSKPNGTLLFTNSAANTNVQATVELYNQAYECDNCGFFRKQWQYFGIPVSQSATFPATGVSGTPTVNQWVEPFNGDKWRPAPYDPTVFKPFKGYEITNSVEPDGVYSFSGILNVGNATVPLTSTMGVNYRGVNLVGNSFTAAIPINEEALQFSPGITDKSVYLFNTGTRDQWRKLNGAIADGLASGTYLAVPIKLTGEEEIPKMIPSMHAFMILTGDAATTLTIDYDKLVKNQTVKDADGNDIAMRSASTTASIEKKSSGPQLPSIKMDVIGEQSADRLWIFTKDGTTHGFDNGWDGRKMMESGIAQLYVADEAGKEHFQVATVPGLDNLALGFTADAEGKYTLEFALSDHWTTEEIYLNDLVTGTQTRVTNGGSYTFEAKKDDPVTRFTLSTSGRIASSGEAAKISVAATDDGKININNRSDYNCTLFISNTAGKLLRRLEVSAGSEQIVEDIPVGTYVVRLQNAAVNDVRRIVVK